MRHNLVVANELDGVIRLLADFFEVFQVKHLCVCVYVCVGNGVNTCVCFVA